MGVNIRNYFTFVFAFAAVLAGIAGVLAAPFLTVHPDMGTSILIVAFIIVVAGGMGSFKGSVIAALVIGVIQSVGSIVLPELAGVFVFLIMIGVLFFRPEGLFGDYEVRPQDTKIALAGHFEPIPITNKWTMSSILLLAVLPLAITELFSSYYIGLISLIFIWAILAISLDFVMGFMGLLSFGHAAFFGIGAYTTALFSIHITNSFAIAILVAILVCIIVGWIMAALSLRVSGVYFALITLAFAQMFHELAFTWESLTGGSNGLTGIPNFSFFGLDLGSPIVYYYLTLVALVLTYFVTFRILDSSFGRVMQAIKESERRISFIGYNTSVYKRRAFALSGGIGGFAGSLLVGYQSFVSPASLHWTISGDVVIAAIFGGLGTLYGPIIGAGIFIGMRDIFSSFTDQWRLLLGVMLILVVMVAPRGVISVYGPGLKAMRLRISNVFSRILGRVSRE